VASYGEAARIMLALRAVLSSGDRGRTLVFDEIDSGVGGRLGPEVGAALRALGEQHQILCVTHLPAIAAAASRHLALAKEVRAGRTRTTIASLDGEARVAEVADMIAGGADEQTARAEARRLLRAGKT
jgi:DNA repair protein RecN (Recombination protein N)